MIDSKYDNDRNANDEPLSVFKNETKILNNLLVKSYIAVIDGLIKIAIIILCELLVIVFEIFERNGALHSLKDL